MLQARPAAKATCNVNEANYMRQAIQTKFLPVTNHRPSRIKAFCEAKSITVDWDHAHNVGANHMRAAAKLAEMLGWKGDWFEGALPGSGYAFVLGTNGRLLEHPVFVISEVA